MPGLGGTFGAFSIPWTHFHSPHHVSCFWCDRGGPHLCLLSPTTPSPPVCRPALPNWPRGGHTWGDAAGLKLQQQNLQQAGAQLSCKTSLEVPVRLTLACSTSSAPAFTPLQPTLCIVSSPARCDRSGWARHSLAKGVTVPFVVFLQHNVVAKLQLSLLLEGCWVPGAGGAQCSAIQV